MTIYEARLEFDVRYFRWGMSEFDKEIQQSFSGLRVFESGPLWRLREFIIRLKERDQLLLAQACLKTTYTAAANVLGMQISPEESLIHRKFVAYWRVKEIYDLLRYHGEDYELPEEIFQLGYPEAAEILGRDWLKDRKRLYSRLAAEYSQLPLSRELLLNAKRAAGEQLKLVKKKTLCRIVREKAEEAFRSHKIGMNSTSERLELCLTNNICGWAINTFFDFGRQGSQLVYSHNVVSASCSEHRGVRVSEMFVPYLISFSGWLGITGETRWDYLIEDDLRIVPDVVIAFCKRFFDAAPELLKGLEPGVIAADET